VKDSLEQVSLELTARRT